MYFSYSNEVQTRGGTQNAEEEVVVVDVGGDLFLFYQPTLLEHKLSVTHSPSFCRQRAGDNRYNTQY